MAWAELPLEIVLLIMGFIPLERCTVNICRAFRSALKNKNHATKMIEAWRDVSAYLPSHQKLGNLSMLTWPDNGHTQHLHDWVGTGWQGDPFSRPPRGSGQRLVTAATQLLRIGIYGKLKKWWFLSAAEWDFVEFVCHGIVRMEVRYEDGRVRECMTDAAYFTCQLLAHRAGYELRWFNKDDWDELRHKVFLMQTDAKIVLDNAKTGVGCITHVSKQYGAEFTESYKTVGDTPDMLRIFLTDGSAVNGDALWPTWRTTGWIRMTTEETDRANAPISEAELFGGSDEEDHTDLPEIQDSAEAPTPWQPDETTLEELFGSSDEEG